MISNPNIDQCHIKPSVVCRQALSLSGHVEDARGELEAMRGVREAEVYELKREVEGLKEERSRY